MGRFLHHPDGRIHINSASITLEDFREDYPEYEVPQGYTGQEYVQNQFHRVFNKKDEKFLDVEWKDGDEYIKKYDRFKKVQEDKEAKKLKEQQDKYDAELAVSLAETERVNKLKDEMNDQVLQEIENKRLEREEARLAFENDPERIKEEEDYEKWVKEQKGLSN